MTHTIRAYPEIVDSMSGPTQNDHARFRKKLGVIGAPLHWIGSGGKPYSYEPYVREMRIWADLFSSVLVCGPSGEGSMRGNLATYDRQNVEWRPVSYTMSLGLRGQLRRLVQLPGLILSACRTIAESEFVLLRSPSHFGLVGGVLVRLMRRPSITKWAGENGAYEGERIPSRVNRWVENLSSTIHYSLVYGQSKRPQQISFIPALMSDEELSEARKVSKDKIWTPPWRILSVGRLRPEKGFDLAFRGLAELNRISPEVSWRYTIIGEGPERGGLVDLAMQCGIADRVTFTGALTFREVQKYYAESHVVIMPGTKEGWPKIIAEAWAHGAIPVGASAGLVPRILQDKDSGVVFEPTPIALAYALFGLLGAPSRMSDMSPMLFRHAADMSLDQFKHRLQEILVDRFGLV